MFSRNEVGSGFSWTDRVWIGFWILDWDFGQSPTHSDLWPPATRSTIHKNIKTCMYGYTKKIDVDEIKLNETIDLFLVKNN